MSKCLILFALFVSISLAKPVAAQDSATDKKLAERAYEILRERCSRCHGDEAKQAGLDVLSREELIEQRGDPDSMFYFIVPGNVSDSTLLETLNGDDSYMPKEGSPEAEEMTTEEKDLLREWVAAGAPFPLVETRAFISEMQILAAMRVYLLASSADDRRYLRFYTLTHLHNNSKVTERDLRLHRAALAKALNSLSTRREIVHPEPLPETNETVYAIDMRKLGWDRDGLWSEIVKHYPYGLKYDFVKNDELKQLWKDVSQFSGADLPYLRADWFTVYATQPPIYHELLGIPETLPELEARLQVDLLENFLDGKVQRAGYAKSGVSKQNRLLERHSTAVTSFFWISYDFLPKRARGDLVRFPLGPRFRGNPHEHQAFEHDGGEIIWSLPNGLQAYMLVNAKGHRIDQGPVEVVFDRSGVLGSPSIVNGISCIYCHRHGMITNFRDEIRNADAVGGLAREHVRRIYPPHDQMQQLVHQDQDQFLVTLEQVIGSYLQVGDELDKPITAFPEPVGKVAKQYFRDLTPTEIALELGFENPEKLQGVIETNRELLRYGLGPMIRNPPGTLKREKWETREGTSLMQDVASELQRGLPFVP